MGVDMSVSRANGCGGLHARGRTLAGAGALTGPSNVSHCWCAGSRCCCGHRVPPGPSPPADLWPGAVHGHACGSVLRPSPTRRPECSPGEAAVGEQVVWKQLDRTVVLGRGRPPFVLPSHSGAPTGSLWAFWWGHSLPGGSVLCGQSQLAAQQSWSRQLGSPGRAYTSHTWAAWDPQGGGCSLASPGWTCLTAVVTAAPTWHWYQCALREVAGHLGCHVGATWTQGRGSEWPQISHRPRPSEVPACAT